MLCPSGASARAWSTSGGCNNTSPVTAIDRHRTPGHPAAPAVPGPADPDPSTPVDVAVSGTAGAADGVVRTVPTPGPTPGGAAWSEPESGADGVVASEVTMATGDVGAGVRTPAVGAADPRPGPEHPATTIASIASIAAGRRPRRPHGFHRVKPGHIGIGPFSPDHAELRKPPETKGPYRVVPGGTGFAEVPATGRENDQGAPRHTRHMAGSARSVPRSNAVRLPSDA